jgi:hypothetical protein
MPRYLCREPFSRWTKKAAVISDLTQTQCFASPPIQRNKTSKNKPKIYPHNSEALDQIRLNIKGLHVVGLY